MPVKRALKLDRLTMGEVPATMLRRSKKNLSSYSPTTGTRLISSPRSNNVQEHRTGPSNGNRDESTDLPIISSRMSQPKMEKNDKLLVLHSEVEASLEQFLQIRQNLTSLQALEGTRELENIAGISDNSGNLKSEVRRTRKLIEQAEKRKLLKRSNERLCPAQDYPQPVNSFEFLKSLIH